MKIISNENISLDFKDNSPQFLAAFENAVERGLFAIGATAEGHAKDRITEAPAVDTGLLRNSITFAVSGEPADISSYKADKPKSGTDEVKKGSYEGNAPNDRDKSVYIGTNVEYAPYIETGTRRRTAVHYLKDAATNHTEQYKKLIKDSLENA